jgi:hypothetical protein
VEVAGVAFPACAAGATQEPYRVGAGRRRPHAAR